MVGIGKKLLVTSSTGAKARVYYGACLSTADFATDVIMLVDFISREEYGFAKGIAFTVGLNMAFQLVIVYAQNSKMGWRKVAIEMGRTIMGMKPALDAWRVAVNEERAVGQRLDAHDEMVMSRIVEIVFECLPSGMMQTYAFLLSEERGALALGSIAISATTTSFVATSISWDLDTSPKKRNLGPDFYGFVMNDQNSRMLTFLAMFTLTTMHVMMKTVSTSLVMCVSGGWLVVYMVVDIGIFLCVKVLRCDYRYWVNLPDPLSLAASFFVRITQKLLTDFTLVMQMRHSYDCGGVGFCVLLVQNQVVCFIAAWL